MAKLNLLAVLKRKKISKRAFGRLLNARDENYWRIFRPGHDPRLSTLITWAKLLKVKVRDLIKE